MTDADCSAIGKSHEMAKFLCPVMDAESCQINGLKVN